MVLDQQSLLSAIPTRSRGSRGQQMLSGTHVVPHGKLKYQLHIGDYVLPSIFILEKVSVKTTQGG